MEVTFREFCLTAYRKPDFDGITRQCQNARLWQGIIRESRMLLRAWEYAAAGSLERLLAAVFLRPFSEGKRAEQ